MKKYIILIAIFTIGLFLGKLIFANSSAAESATNNTEKATENQLWTCSMHPQIMQPEFGDCPICGMDLIPAEASADGLEADQFKLTKNAMALANIQTSVVGNATTSDDNGAIKLSGKIVKNEEANKVQVSYFSGRIERLNVSFTGEEIRKGQLLATIYSPELFAAQQELLTTLSLKESQPALYKAVRNKLKLWKLSENQINQIETSQKVKENFPVYATVSGTVSEKLVEQGQYVKQGQPLLKIANLNTVWANFDVYENQLNLFKKGQEIVITTNAYANKEFKEKISFIDPVLDTRTRTVKLRAVLNNRKGTFKPGMFVEGKVTGIKPSKNKKKSLLIPATAVLWTGKRSVVYIKSSPDEPIFEMREIGLGNKVGENYEVLEGLENGEKIVTNGTFTVDAAAQLQGKKSMMNKQDGKTTSTDHLKIYERINVSSKFQEQLKTVFDTYIKLKNALVADDSKQVKEIANSIGLGLEKVDMKLLKNDKAHEHWMRLEKEIKSAANSIANTLEIKKQRDYFIGLSSHFTSAIQLFGINKEVYSEFCPMVNDNKGAYWLSLEKEIKNPYFGKAMLTCGEVKQTIN